MKDREPTMRSRALGEGLHRAMEYAGYNGTQLADQLDWSQGRVSRLPTGKRGASGYDVSAVLAICHVKGSEQDRLMTLPEDHIRPGWFMQHGPVVPKQMQTLIDCETGQPLSTNSGPAVPAASRRTSPASMAMSAARIGERCCFDMSQLR